MFFTEFERFFAPRILAPLLGGLLIAAAWQNGSRAASTDDTRATYVISDHEGYGILDCLTQKRDCGKIVADSWCEAHGHGPALAYGRADDVTFATASASSRTRIDAEAAIISCRE